MSELKAVHAFDVYEAYTKTGDDDAAQVYLKSEADKVIEEKDAEIARLKAIRKVHVEAIESMGAGLLQDEEENRHSKYRRCLAMAKWCRRNRLHASVCGPVEKIDFFEKWRKRWLELAEKFKNKEAK